MTARAMSIWGSLILASASCAADQPGEDCSTGKCDDTDAVLAPVDVAFLIPPARASAKPIKVSEKGAFGELMPNAGFFDVVSAGAREFHAGPGGALGIPTDAYGSLTVTGVRYDPCAPEQFSSSGAPIEGADCQQELRLVVQPVSNGSAADAAIHLIYALSAEEGASVRKSLRAIKAACNVDTTTVPVGPHPCLANLASGDAAAVKFLDEQIRPMILEHAGAMKLGGAASMVTVSVSQKIEWHWRLFFRNPQTGELLQSPGLPNIASDVAAFKQDGSLSPEPATLMADAGLGALATVPLQFITADGAPKDPRDPSHEVTPAELRDGLLAAYTLENPRLSSLPVKKFVTGLVTGQAPNRAHVDCASCHVQSPALTIFEGDKASLIDDALRAEIEMVRYPLKLEHLPATRALHERTLVPGRSDYIVINFGFLGRDPSVNRRVANEAEEVAAYIKDVLR